MLAELGFTPPPKKKHVCTVWAGTARTASGQLQPAPTSCTRLVWQFLRSGPCSSTLGAPGCNDSNVPGLEGPPPTPPPPSPCTQGCAWCQCPGPHRGPIDEPVRLLLAVDDDAVALPPLLGRPVRGKGSTRAPSPPLLLGSSGTSFCPAPSLSPSRCCERPALTGAAPAPA